MRPAYASLRLMIAIRCICRRRLYGSVGLAERRRQARTLLWCRSIVAGAARGEAGKDLARRIPRGLQDQWVACRPQVRVLANPGCDPGQEETRWRGPFPLRPAPPTWRVRTKMPRPIEERGQCRRKSAVLVLSPEFRETPRAKALCRVAPTVLFSAFAILAAGVFFFAMDLRSLRSCFVHARRFCLVGMIISLSANYQTVCQNRL
jgi:hypothetical protein